MIEPSSVIIRNETVLAADVVGEIVLMSVEKGSYFGLNEVGSDIWKRLARPLTFGGLCAELVTDYDAEPEIIARETEALLIRLHQRRLIELRN